MIKILEETYVNYSSCILQCALPGQPCALLFIFQNIRRTFGRHYEKESLPLFLFCTCLLISCFFLFRINVGYKLNMSGQPCALPINRSQSTMKLPLTRHIQFIDSDLLQLVDLNTGHTGRLVLVGEKR